jgi:HK97 gp10 family phage protein
LADISVKGLSELNKFLQELPGKIEANVVAGGLRAGAIVFRDAVREAIPVDSGLTKKDLKISTRKDRRTGLVTAKLAFKRRAYIARFIEFGTKPHKIKGPVTLNGKVYSGVAHPGARPRPFMRPAFDGQTKAATYAFGAYIRKRLQAKHGIDTSDVQIGDEE